MLISVDDNGLRKVDKVVTHQPVSGKLSCGRVGGQSVCVCHDAVNVFCRCGTAQRGTCPPSSNAVPPPGSPDSAYTALYPWSWSQRTDYEMYRDARRMRQIRTFIFDYRYHNEQMEHIMDVVLRWHAMDKIYARWHSEPPEYPARTARAEMFARDMRTWVYGLQAEYYGVEDPHYEPGEIRNAHTSDRRNLRALSR